LLRRRAADDEGLQHEVADKQAEAEHARDDLETAQAVERLAEQAHLNTEEELERTYGEAAELRKLLQNDLQEWIAETEQRETAGQERAKKEIRDENLERIQRSAEEALARAKVEEQGLFDDVASLLQGAS